MTAIDPPAARHNVVSGLVLTAVLASLALWVAGIPWVKDNIHISALLLVILLGMAWKSLLPVPDVAQPGIRMAQRPILRWAVAGLGLRLSIQELWSLGGPALIVVTVSTAAALWFGWWICERLGLTHKLSLLLGVGGAICGASAIVAADSVVQSEKQESAVALGTITLLGTLGIVIYPPIGSLLALNDQVYGIWTGASLHEMAQVVAAGFGISEDASRIATVAKLARITLLAPVVFWLAWIMRRHHEKTGHAKVSIVPWFLLVFVAFAALNSLNVIPAELLAVIRRVDVWLLCVGMAGVGLQIGLRDLRTVGWRPIAAGSLQWAFLALLSLGLTIWLHP